MGTSGSSLPPPDSQDVLIHSFLLDPSFDCLQIPWIMRRKNAMFHVPANMDPRIEHFLPMEEAKKILEDLNKILHETGFDARPPNLCFFIALFVGMAPLFSTLFFGLKKVTGWLLFLWLFLTIIIYFSLWPYFRYSRRNRLTDYVLQWNRSAEARGVKLSFGGGAIGSDEGGTYENFYMATWDYRSLMFKGYLYVFVNMIKRQEWCRNTGQPYLPPMPRGQIQAAYGVFQPPPGGFQPSPGGFQPPPGGFQPPPGGFETPHVLQSPPGGFQPQSGSYQPPPGYILVPVNEQPSPTFVQEPLPPTYEDAIGSGDDVKA